MNIENDIEKSLACVINHIEIDRDHFSVPKAEKEDSFIQLTDEERLIFMNFKYIRKAAIDNVACGIPLTSLKHHAMAKVEAEKLVQQHMKNEPNQVRWSVMFLLNNYL